MKTVTVSALHAIASALHEYINTVRPETACELHAMAANWIDRLFPNGHEICVMTERVKYMGYDKGTKLYLITRNAKVKVTPNGLCYACR